MNYTTSKSGSNTVFKIENGESIRHAMPSRCSVVVGDDGVMTVRTTNKSEAAAVEFAIKNAAVKTGPKIHVSETGSVSIRRIVLSSMATGSTGKSWYATGKNVDEFGLPPSWEGQLICYEYTK